MHKTFHSAAQRAFEATASNQAKRIVAELKCNSLPGVEHDRFGYNPRSLLAALPLLLFLYKIYHRVSARGTENIPLEGPGILAGNHSGVVPVDGAMVLTACLTELSPPRLPRGMYEKWIASLPFVHDLYSKMGHATGLPENADAMLEDGELLLIFPEGARGNCKPSSEKYKLQPFGVGFVEMAVRHKAPIVPFAVIGGEEQTYNFFNSTLLARTLQMPFFPITPTFPWLGPFGVVWAPTRYRIRFGEPIRFEDCDVEALHNPDLARRLADRVKSAIAALIERGLKERKSVFF